MGRLKNILGIGAGAFTNSDEMHEANIGAVYRKENLTFELGTGIPLFDGKNGHAPNDVSLRAGLQWKF